MSMGFYSIADEPAIELHPEHTGFYQDRPCTFSIFELNNQDLGKYNVEFLHEPSGNVECFGKNSWFEYQPPKLVENGWDRNEPDKIKVWISTNLNLDLLIQSIFWFLLFSFIPKSKQKNFKNILIVCFLNTVIFYLHLLGENSYYKNISREYDISLLSREFNGDLYYGNYFLYMFLGTIFIVSYLVISISQYRFYNIVNYIPFVFVIFGTYSSLNLNIYLIIFSIFGLFALLENKVNTKITVFYLLFSIYWIYNLEVKELNFDVDKLRGFVNSSQTTFSMIYWILIFYLTVSGLSYVFSESRNYFDGKLFRRNLLISSSLVFLLGNLTALSKLTNYFSFYFLGLNKFGMRSQESIAGNTWRGIAPSAEGMGEFFAFVILFTVIYSYQQKYRLHYIEILLFLITLFGLIRSNNFAAMSSIFFIILLFFLNERIGSKKLIIIFMSFLIIISGFAYSQFFREFSFSYLSSNILYEGVKASEIDYKMSINQYGLNQAEQANYQYILEIPEDRANLSSSLRFLLENYTYGYNIKYIPSLVSVVNIGSYLINRSEKWGIFFAKYNPSIDEFLLGYGPQQITHYYFDHPTKYNYGLFLPHSSIFNYLIFFGFLGLLLISSMIFFKFKKENVNKLTKLLLVFFFLNFIKSDSLLYLPNLILFVLIVNFYKFKDSENNQQEIE